VDVRSISSITDIRHRLRSSEPQLRAIAEEMTANVTRSTACPRARTEHWQTGWLVLDFFDVISTSCAMTCAIVYDLKAFGRCHPALSRLGAQTSGEG